MGMKTSSSLLNRKTRNGTKPLHLFLLWHLLTQASSSFVLYYFSKKLLLRKMRELIEEEKKKTEKTTERDIICGYNIKILRNIYQTKIVENEKVPVELVTNPEACQLMNA